MVTLMGNIDVHVNSRMPVAHLAPAGRTPEESITIQKELMLSFGKTKDMVRWLSDKVGLKFPWTKYYQIVSPKIAGGAMENSSLVTWTDRFFCDDRLHTERGLLLDLVIVHEMAHTYFGDLLYV
jgi:aminopeptidase N